MAKYIDKDEVVDMLRMWGQEAAETNSSEATAFEAVAYELQHFPEDDVVPVVRGHWHVIKTSCAGMIATSYQCTVCGKTCATQMRLFHDDAVPTYCCWCGARMDKEAPIGSDTD